MTTQNKESFSKRSLARLIACQALCMYSNEIIVEKRLNVILEDINQYYIKPNFTSQNKIFKNICKHEFVVGLVNGVLEHQEEIDAIIAEHLHKKDTLETLDEVLKATLRLAIYELKYLPDTAKEIIVNEYIDIASEFLPPNEIVFVNGILDSIAVAVRGGQKRAPEKRQFATTNNTNSQHKDKKERKIIKLNSK